MKSILNLSLCLFCLIFPVALMASDKDNGGPVRTAREDLVISK